MWATVQCQLSVPIFLILCTTNYKHTLAGTDGLWGRRLISDPCRSEVLEDPDVKQEYDPLSYNLDATGSNTRHNKSIVAVAPITTPPAKISSNSMPSISHPPTLHFAFHNISAWKRLLNVTFMPGMKAWVIAVWQMSREKEKGRRDNHPSHWTWGSWTPAASPLFRLLAQSFLREEQKRKKDLT